MAEKNIERFHATPSPPTLRLDLLIFEEDSCYVVHCVQLDVVHSVPIKEGRDNIFKEAMDLCVAHVLYAFEKNRLASLFRPPNPALLAKMIRARSEGTLEVQFTAQLDNVEVESGIEFQRLAA